MKLCVLMPAHWTGRLGGAEIQARYLMQHLKKVSNHELAVICRHSSVDADEGIPIRRIQTVWPIARYTYLIDYPSVQRLLRQLDPDVIYTRVGSPLVGFAARYCHQFGKRLVHHIARVDDVLPRTQIPTKNALQAVERRIYEYGLVHADAIIAQASYQAELLERHFRRSNIEVIANYHPTPQFAPAKDSAFKTVLWVANIKEAKRPGLFIELAERSILLHDTRFVMVGALSDERYEPLLARARELPNFHYAGAAPLEDVNRLLESAHLFVNTSAAMGEGFPNTFIQSWLRGVPVVSLECNPDGLLDSGDLGSCAQGDSQRLARDVQTLLSDTTRLTRMADNCRRHALTTYASDNLERVQRVLESRPATPRGT